MSTDLDPTALEGPLSKYAQAAIVADLERTDSADRAEEEAAEKVLAPYRELVAEVKRLRFQLSEARLRIEGQERIEERICRHIPEHYEAGYNALEDWANDAAAVVAEAQKWRKRGRSDEDAAKLDAAVEKIYPSDDYP